MGGCCALKVRVGGGGREGVRGGGARRCRGLRPLAAAAATRAARPFTPRWPPAGGFDWSVGGLAVGLGGRGQEGEERGRGPLAPAAAVAAAAPGLP